MAHHRNHKTSFAAGEISPLLIGRGDLRAYENGASRLANVFIHPTGGLSRRDGLRYVDTARGPGRLVAFEFNIEQVYLLVFSAGMVDVYREGNKVAEIDAPWSAEQIRQIDWTQTADTLLVVHAEVSPRKITRGPDESWTINEWSFVEEVGERQVNNATRQYDRIHQPFHKFADIDLTLAASGTSGSINLTASADFFLEGHVGLRFRIEDREIVIDAVTSPTQAGATVKETLKGTAATKDWEEQSFSPLRGWPASVCFHQDRMVIGGSRDLPNRLWLSKSSDLFNHDLGEGLDDEAIEFAILSDQVNAVRAVFSGRHLQVLTSGAEWMVGGDPLTPSKLQLHRQTRIGSPIDRRVKPCDVDGATIFIPRSGPELREFLFADVEQAYQANDLAMLAQHLIDEPQDQDYDTSRRLLHVVMRDGRLCTLTIYRAEEVTAWTEQTTDGYFRSVAQVGEETCFLIERGGDFLIEAFDPALHVDSGLVGVAEEVKSIWTGLEHLEGREVMVAADGAVRAPVTVTGGQVELDEPASQVEIGLAYTHRVVPLPPANTAGGEKLRPVSVTFRLHRTASLRVDVGRGFVETPFKRFGESLLDRAPQPFSGDRKIRAFGWRTGGLEPLWRIEDVNPLPFSLLAVTAEISGN